MWNFLKQETIYLDYAATTPIDIKVLSAMNRVYQNNYFNPGALYASGVVTAQMIQESRKKVAKELGTTSDHVIFTRGGTESCNMGIMGSLTNLTPNPSPERRGELPHVITSAIEHAAVLETLKDLEAKKQIELSIIPVDEQGIVIVENLKKALRPETVLVSVMYVNNEIGTVQPIKEITKLVRWYKKNLTPNPSPERRGEPNHYPLVHIDAIQATNYLDINVERLGVDLMSLSGSKIYGPKSSGVLYVRNRALLGSLFHGGDQEFGLRAGTEDVAQIVGFTKALEITRSHAEQESLRLQKLQTFFFEELQKCIPDMIINGVWNPLLLQNLTPSPSPERRGEPNMRIPNNINITIPGISGERLVIELDAKGICAASKSACKEDDGEASHVIAAIRKPHPDPLLKGEGDTTSGSLRFTMGRSTTKRDVIKTVRILGEIVERIRNFEKSL
jgi:cysteine desulfurase